MTVESIKRKGQQHEEAQLRKEAYIEWLLTPVGERELRSKAKFAVFLGVTEQTLRNYDKDPWVQSEIVKRGRAAAKVDKLPQVIENLYAIATGAVEAPAASQVSAARALIDWTERTHQELSADDLKDMSKEDLLDLVEKVYDRVEELK